MGWVPVEKVGGPVIGDGRLELATLTEKHRKEGIWVRPCGHLRGLQLSVADLEDDSFLLSLLDILEKFHLQFLNHLLINRVVSRGSVSGIRTVCTISVRKEQMLNKCFIIF